MASTKNYNLLDEKWIPVLSSEGVEEEVGLLELFERAHSIIQVLGDLPTTAVAIQRMLLAITYRAIGGVDSVADWQRKFSDWSQVNTQVSNYLEKYRERFWLEHPTEPFFQVADLGPTTKEIHGVARIIPDYSENTPFFITRGPRSLEELSLSEAARWLIHAHAFDDSGIKTPDRHDPRQKGGKVYPLGTSWTGKIENVLLSGDNLAETIAYNTIAPVSVRATTSENDLPPWERQQLTALPEIPEGAQPEGFVQLLTWQTRRIRLYFRDNHVFGVTLCYGDPVAEQNKSNLEPYSTWRYSKPQTDKNKGQIVYMPGLVDPSKDMWRAFSAWLPTAVQHEEKNGAKEYRSPLVLEWIGKLGEHEIIDSELKVNVNVTGVSYGSNSCGVSEIIHQSLKVPTFLLDPDNTDLASDVLYCISDADNAARRFSWFCQNLANAQGNHETESIRDKGRETAYQEIGKHFEQWLHSLRKDQETLHVRADWQRDVKKIIFQLAEKEVRIAGPAAYFGRAALGERPMNAEVALRILNNHLRTVLPEAYKKEETGVQS